MFVNQPGYIMYKQAQKTSQYNVFEITFKTIDATGMLLHAQSVEKGDFLTIELIRGRIRFAYRLSELVDLKVSWHSGVFL